MQLAFLKKRRPGSDGGDMALVIGNAARSSSSSSSSGRTVAALLVALAVLGLLGYGSMSSSDGRGSRVARVLAATKTSGSLVLLACNATRYRQECISSLGSDSRSSSASPEQIIQIAVDISSQVSSRSLQLTSGLRTRAGGDKNLTEASNVCVEVLQSAARRFDQCKFSLRGGANFSTRAIKDSEAWLSAALSFQYDCWSALSYVNSSKEVQRIMAQVQSGILSISNALSMVDAFDLYGPRPSDWKPPPSKRSRNSAAMLPTTAEWLAHNDRRLLAQQLGKLKIQATVSKDGSSGLSSVQHAIDSAPDNATTRYIIHVKEGIYRERVVVPASKTMILLLGDGINRTIITGSEYVRDGVTTMNTYTMLVAGDGFMARDMTVENTAGPELHQAVAVRVDADQVAFQSCSFLGFQDTLYSHTLRHYFKDSTIMGTVDFIFGNAAAVFEDCRILVRPGRKGVTTSMVSAHGRIDPGQTTGFAFNNCSIDASKDFLPIFNSDKKKYKTYLGRPWKEFSRSVYLGCYLGAIVPPEGWLAWKGDFALDTLYFGEYQSQGPGGSDVSRRVSWSTQMRASDVPAYSTQYFLQGPEWGIS